MAAACYSILRLFVEIALTSAAAATTFTSLAQARDEAVGHGLREYSPELCDGLAARLLARIDQTAGTAWMPAARRRPGMTGRRGSDRRQTGRVRTS